MWNLREYSRQKFVILILRGGRQSNGVFGG